MSNTNQIEKIMSFEQKTNVEDLKWSICLLNCSVECEVCNKETQVVEELNYDSGMMVCPVCMQKFATQ